MIRRAIKILLLMLLVQGLVEVAVQVFVQTAVIHHVTSLNVKAYALLTALKHVPQVRLITLCQ